MFSSSQRRLLSTCPALWRLNVTWPEVAVGKNREIIAKAIYRSVLARVRFDKFVHDRKRDGDLDRLQRYFLEGFSVYTSLGEQVKRSLFSIYTNTYFIFIFIWLYSVNVILKLFALYSFAAGIIHTSGSSSILFYSILSGFNATCLWRHCRESWN